MRHSDAVENGHESFKLGNGCVWRSGVFPVKPNLIGSHWVQRRPLGRFMDAVPSYLFLSRFLVFFSPVRCRFVSFSTFESRFVAALCARLPSSILHGPATPPRPCVLLRNPVQLGEIRRQQQSMEMSSRSNSSRTRRLQRDSYQKSRNVPDRDENEESATEEWGRRP